MERVEIRQSMPDDLAAIELIYRQAFPDEDLLPLVRALWDTAYVACSLVGIIGASVVGHVVFTSCKVDESDDEVALLGPLAVTPDMWRQGIGRAIVRAGLQRLADAGVTQVYVLGDPAYYSRSGFVPELHVLPPYPLPEAWRGAWQSMRLGGIERSLRGKLAVPPPWQQPALWAP